jgi:hypothetical protein
MFPKEIDGAKVLYYTPKDNYGDLRYDSGEISDYYHYLAICKYEKDENYYLFCCNEKYEVAFDFIGNSVDSCMEIARKYKANIFWNEMQYLYT